MAEITALDGPGGRGLDGDGEGEGREDEKAAESGHVWLVVSAEIISFVRKAAQLEEEGRTFDVMLAWPRGKQWEKKPRLTSLGESEKRKWGVARGEAKTSWRAGVDRAGHYMRTGEVWKSLVRDFVWRTRAQHPMRRMGGLAVECLDQNGGRSRLDVCGNQLSDMHASHKLSLVARGTQETGWRRA